VSSLEDDDDLDDPGADAGIQISIEDFVKETLIKPRSSVQGGLSLVYETSTRDDSASLAL
jgi:hypothetical protein